MQTSDRDMLGCLFNLPKGPIVVGLLGIDRPTRFRRVNNPCTPIYNHIVSRDGSRSFQKEGRPSIVNFNPLPPP